MRSASGCRRVSGRVASWGLMGGSHNEIGIPKILYSNNHLFSSFLEFEEVSKMGGSVCFATTMYVYVNAILYLAFDRPVWWWGLAGAIWGHVQSQHIYDRLRFSPRLTHRLLREGRGCRWKKRREEDSGRGSVLTTLL